MKTDLLLENIKTYISLDKEEVNFFLSLIKANTIKRENWWVSDLLSFITQTPAQYTIDALEDTEVLQISKPDIDKLYEKVPKFERFFRIILQNAFVAHQQRIEQNLSLPAEERYHFFTEKYPHMSQRIPQKQIASYLGITPVFLSMLRRKKLK